MSRIDDLKKMIGMSMEMAVIMMTLMTTPAEVAVVAGQKVIAIVKDATTEAVTMTCSEIDVPAWKHGAECAGIAHIALRAAETATAVNAVPVYTQGTGDHARDRMTQSIIESLTNNAEIDVVHGDECEESYAINACCIGYFANKS